MASPFLMSRCKVGGRWKVEGVEGVEGGSGRWVEGGR